jgi:hypothetical protein
MQRDPVTLGDEDADEPLDEPRITVRDYRKSELHRDPSRTTGRG